MPLFCCTSLVSCHVNGAKQLWKPHAESSSAAVFVRAAAVFRDFERQRETWVEAAAFSTWQRRPGCGVHAGLCSILTHSFHRPRAQLDDCTNTCYNSQNTHSFSIWHVLKTKTGFYSFRPKAEILLTFTSFWDTPHSGTMHDGSWLPITAQAAFMSCRFTCCFCSLCLGPLKDAAVSSCAPSGSTWLPNPLCNRTVVFCWFVAAFHHTWHEHNWIQGFMLRCGRI